MMKYHKFGGIWFVETGEDRPAENDEWALNDGFDGKLTFHSIPSLLHHNGPPTVFPYIILRPVAIINKENE